MASLFGGKLSSKHRDTSKYGFDTKTEGAPARKDSFYTDSLRCAWCSENGKDLEQYNDKFDMLVHPWCKQEMHEEALKAKGGGRRKKDESTD